MQGPAKPLSSVRFRPRPPIFENITGFVYFHIIVLLKMKKYSSLKSAKNRDKNCKLVRRKGKLYIINKLKPRFKAYQG